MHGIPACHRQEACICGRGAPAAVPRAEKVRVCHGHSISCARVSVFKRHGMRARGSGALRPCQEARLASHIRCTGGILTRMHLPGGARPWIQHLGGTFKALVSSRALA